jgi:hypothetical protein
MQAYSDKVEISAVMSPYGYDAYGEKDDEAGQGDEVVVGH